MLASLFGSVEADTIGGIVVLIVTVVGGALSSRLRDRRATKKADEKTVLKKLEELSTVTNEMHIAMVGASPTLFDPNPKPGLVTIVPKLQASVERVEHTLFVNGGEGNTIVDRLERVEAIGKANGLIASRVESVQHEQD